MGVTMVVAATMMTMGARKMRFIIPVAIPLLVTIRATSPRDTMPTPMRRDSALV